MSRNKEHRPNGAAAEGGASVLFVSAHLFPNSLPQQDRGSSLLSREG